MDATARLDSVDNDANVLAVARRHLGGDPRVTFHLTDGAEFLSRCAPGQLDLVFADAWPGKFTHLDDALSLLRLGGIYLIDDLLPQATWPEGQAPKVAALVDRLARRTDFASVRLDWASGLMVLVRTQLP
jgi:predicted O-methyltransferase YrrM